MISALLLSLALGGGLQGPPPGAVQAVSGERVALEVEYRAFRFFWEQSDPRTGLAKDREDNRGPDHYTVASIATTGYALAALPVAVEHGWLSRPAALRRARTTLRFLLTRQPSVHGWYFHFVDMRTGARVWKCEVSTIDTSLLVCGALVCGRYFHSDVERLAGKLYDRLDWTWVRTNGGAQPAKRVVTMGWKPESGFLSSNWDSYCELPIIYLLGLGAARKPLPPESWYAWKRPVYRYAGMETLGGGPIFLHEMAFAYFRLKDRRDRLGWDYWAAAASGVRINRQFCIDNGVDRKPDGRKTYGPDVWGLNASDGPKGYNAYGVPAPEDGTVSPTGAIAAILFMPREALSAARTMRERFGDRLWGRYGFADAFNLDADWFDKDVIGIDLGMALLAIENHRTGLIWRLMDSLPSTRRAYRAAGLRKAAERPSAML